MPTDQVARDTIASGFGARAEGLVGGAAAQVKGQRLSRLMRNTAIRNPHLLPPWKVPANWAQSTTYLSGEVVVANGYWWVAQSATGVSAASGTGPSNVDIRGVLADGTVQWLLLGPPTGLADDAQGPTITRSTSAPGAPTDAPWVYASDCVRFYGGRQVSTLADRWRNVTFNRSASSTERGAGGRLAFWSDAATISLLTDAISGGSEAPFRIVVDGRYLTPSAFSNANALTYTTIAWPTRKPRFYEIEAQSKEGFFMSLRAIYTSSLDLVWKPEIDDDFRVWWISDSQSAGAHNFGGFAPGGGIPQRVARLMGWNDVWNASTGGTGYVNPGSGPFYTYGERVAEGITRNPDAWVFYGSTNDNGQTSGTITAAVLATLQAVRAGSSAPIFIVGVEPVNASCAATETAMQAAVTQFNDAQTFFIPLANATPYPSIIGSYNRPAALPGTLNTFSRDVNNTDSIHLMENVFQKHADFIAKGIRAAVAGLR